MESLLGLAISHMMDIDARAQLVHIMGIGMNAEGYVRLHTPSFVPRWQFGFYNADQHRWSSITWLSSAFKSLNPHVDKSAGNLIATEIIGLRPKDIPGSVKVASRLREIGITFSERDDDVLSYCVGHQGDDIIHVGARLAPPENRSQSAILRMKTLELVHKSVS